MVTQEMDIKIDDKKVDQNSFVGKALLYENTRMQKTHLKKNSIHSISLIQLLANLKHITHSRLIARDMFQDRIKNGGELYMHEMLYPVFQGMDSVVLSQIYGSCDLEIGGTDQTFNMIIGRDIMKANNLEPQSVLALDIIPGTDGVEKMSKSLDNYIAITDSSNDMFGKTMSVPDGCLESYFELATYTPKPEIKEIIEKIASGALHPRDAKLRLAREITAIYHGDTEAKAAEEGFINTFSKGGVPKDIQTVEVKKGDKLVDIVIQSSLVDSKSEWRRLVGENAVTNTTSDRVVEDADAIAEDDLVLKIGKHRFLKIEVK
jgi:tyrosyl-tRNA synthetase